MLPQTRLPHFPPEALGPKSHLLGCPPESVSTPRQKPAVLGPAPATLEHGASHKCCWRTERGCGASTFISMLQPVTHMLTDAALLCTCCSFSCVPFPPLATSNATLPLTIPQHKQRALTPACPCELDCTRLPRRASLFISPSPPTPPEGRSPAQGFLCCTRHLESS